MRPKLTPDGKQNMAGKGDLPLDHKLIKFQASPRVSESEIKSISVFLRSSRPAAGQDYKV